MSSSFLRDPTVAAASFEFVSHRCAKEAKDPKNIEAVKQCFTREVKALDQACHKELVALTECVEGETNCRKPAFDLRVCVRANFGFDTLLEERKRYARAHQQPVPTELPDSAKVEAAAARWK